MLAIIHNLYYIIVKEVSMKSKIKKIIFTVVFIFLLFILVLLTHLFFSPLLNKLFFENYILNISAENISDVFAIDRIVLFSSCSSDTTINSNNTTTINNLNQFTDIAIFINNENDEYTLENTLKSVSIKGISFNTTPNLGTPNLYYKGLNDFAKFSVNEENLLSTDLDFSVSSEDEINYDKPILFNNCANPITLGYVNSNIKTDYTINNSDSAINYDGSLLKRCNVLLDDINCSLSFTIYIENNLGEHFKCPIYISIPLQNETNSIYDGSYTYIYNPNYTFYKY